MYVGETQGSAFAGGLAQITLLQMASKYLSTVVDTMHERVLNYAFETLNFEMKQTSVYAVCTDKHD